MISYLDSTHIGRWVIYKPDMENERGKIKGFDNENRRAWVVYNADGLLHGKEEWKRYTGQATRYDDLVLDGEDEKLNHWNSKIIVRQYDRCSFMGNMVQDAVNYHLGNNEWGSCCSKYQGGWLMYYSILKSGTMKITIWKELAELEGKDEGREGRK